MKISIICPFYNCEKYISKCIESIIAQSYKNWELILIDDGSTDNSFQIAESYLNDKRIFLYKQENSGQGVARNNGMSHATGQFVTFIDSDDYLDNDYFLNVVSILLKNIKIDVLSTNYRYIRGNKVESCFLTKEQASFSNTDCYRIFLAGGTIHSAPWAKFYSNSFLKVFQILFPPFRAREDIYFENLIYFYAKEILVSNIFGYNVVLHDDSTEGKGFYAEKIKALEAGKKSIELCNEHNILIKESQIFFNNIYCFCIKEFCLSNQSTDIFSRDLLISYSYLANFSLMTRKEKKLCKLFALKTSKATRYCTICKTFKRIKHLVTKH